MTETSVTQRQERGKALYEQGRVQERANETYVVEGETGRYTVSWTLQYCSCPDNRRGNEVCKHLWAVSEKLRRETPVGEPRPKKRESRFAGEWWEDIPSAATLERMGA